MPLFLPGQGHPPMLRQEKPQGHLIPTVNVKSISQRSIISNIMKNNSYGSQIMVYILPYMPQSTSRLSVFHDSRLSERCKYYWH